MICMTKWYRSLSTKLVVSFVILITIISSISFVIVFQGSQKAVTDATKDMLREEASTMATQINVSKMMSLSPGDENTSTYLDLIHQMRPMRANSDFVVNVYTMKIVDGDYYFIVDDTEDGPASIGQLYEDPDEKNLEIAMSRSSASDSFYTDEFGTFMSGYAPVKDSNNQTVAILGVDMTAVGRMQQIDDLRTNNLLLTIGLTIVASILVLFISVTIIRDLKKLNKAAETISMGDMNTEVSVHRKDEVGELAESFGRMIASLKFEIMVREEEENKGKAAIEADDQEVSK
jgi:HAMP domain-containing protein